jgi:hypothetical protein
MSIFSEYGDPGKEHTVWNPDRLRDRIRYAERDIEMIQAYLTETTIQLAIVNTTPTCRRMDFRKERNYAVNNRVEWGYHLIEWPDIENGEKYAYNPRYDNKTDRRAVGNEHRAEMFAEAAAIAREYEVPMWFVGCIPTGKEIKALKAAGIVWEAGV